MFWTGKSYYLHQSRSSRSSVKQNNFTEFRSNRTILFFGSYCSSQDNFIFKIVLLDRFGCISLITVHRALCCIFRRLKKCQHMRWCQYEAWSVNILFISGAGVGLDFFDPIRFGCSQMPTPAQEIQKMGIWIHWMTMNMWDAIQYFKIYILTYA